MRSKKSKITGLVLFEINSFIRRPILELYLVLSFLFMALSITTSFQTSLGVEFDHSIHESILVKFLDILRLNLSSFLFFQNIIMTGLVSYSFLIEKEFVFGTTLSLPVNLPMIAITKFSFYLIISFISNLGFASLLILINPLEQKLEIIEKLFWVFFFNNIILLVLSLLVILLTRNLLISNLLIITTLFAVNQFLSPSIEYLGLPFFLEYYLAPLYLESFHSVF